MSKKIYDINFIQTLLVTHDSIFNKDKINKLLSIKNNNKFIQRKNTTKDMNNWRIVNTHNIQEIMNANLNKLSINTYDKVVNKINTQFKETNYDESLVNIYFEKTLTDTANIDLYSNLLQENEKLNEKYLEKYNKINIIQLDLTDKNNYVNIDRFINYHTLSSYLIQKSIINSDKFTDIYNSIIKLIKETSDENLLNTYIKSLNNLIQYSVSFIKENSLLLNTVNNDINYLIDYIKSKKKLQFLLMDISDLL